MIDFLSGNLKENRTMINRGIPCGCTHTHTHTHTHTLSFSK